jgi:hypothetical protein
VVQAFLTVVVAAPLGRHLEGVDFEVRRHREVQHVPRPDDANTHRHRTLTDRLVRLRIDRYLQAWVAVVAICVTGCRVAGDHLPQADRLEGQHNHERDTQENRAGGQALKQATNLHPDVVFEMVVYHNVACVGVGHRLVGCWLHMAQAVESIFFVMLRQFGLGLRLRLGLRLGLRLRLGAGGYRCCCQLLFELLGALEQCGTLLCSPNGYLSSRGRCQNRWHSLVNCDHGDSTTSRFDSPRARDISVPCVRCAAASDAARHQPQLT